MPLNSSLQNIEIPNSIAKDSLSNIFGTGATAIDYLDSSLSCGVVSENNLSSQLFWLMAIVLILLLYVLLITIYRRVVIRIFSSSFIDGGVEKFNSFFDVEKERAVTFSYYFLTPFVLSFLSVVICNFLDLTFNNFALFGATMALIYFMIGVRYFAGQILQIITDNYSLIPDVLTFAKISSLSFSLLLSPILLLSTFLKANSGWYIYLAPFLIIILIINYFFRLYNYFRVQNVSFLQYILYLCAVEIVPLSCFITLLSRKFLYQM